jgi:hypothetical protein
MYQLSINILNRRRWVTYRIGIAGLDVRGVKMLMTIVKKSHFEESFKETGSGFDIDFNGQRSGCFPQIGYIAGNSSDVNFSILHQLTLPVEPNQK